MPYGIELDRLASRWAAQPTSTCFAALAEALRKRGALNDAVAVARAGVAARPEFLPGHLVMARILGEQQQWDAAHAELQAALLLDASHPVALEARDAVARQLGLSGAEESAGHTAASDELRERPMLPPDDELEDLVYSDDDDGDGTTASEPVVTESLAMLYRGQGHLAQAVHVLDALVARTPENADLVAKRNALRVELDEVRPRPYSAAHSGGAPVRDWLSALAGAQAPDTPPRSGLDAFYEAPAEPRSGDGDLQAFQSWLRELER